MAWADGLNSVDHIRDDQLRTAMAEEPVAFFEQVLQANGSVMDFIHSDYAVVNAKLAQHYRIPMCTVCISARWPSRPGTNAAG